MYLPPLIGSVQSAWYQQGDVPWKVQLTGSETYLGGRKKKKRQNMQVNILMLK